jgi:O-methyltransferase/8-demethyl-8-(2,3-dimethoxy-alpha-L-rhamnosyl)tetracenomycin-C 4'-O-methyltransferase
VGALPDQSHRDAYVDLIKRSVTNYLYLGGKRAFDKFRCITHYDLKHGQWKIDALARPVSLLTQGQLDLVEQAVIAVENEGVPGDFIEAGVWRGGVIILMRALLDAYQIAGRRVFAADSFAGIPTNNRAINDPVDMWNDRWIASLEEVQWNIARFGVLDERILFLPGFFSDSLKHLARERFALIRLDSDSYDSVETSLDYLYPLLSKGGIVIIDDWHLPGCKMAVVDYRTRHGITDEIRVHEGNAFWTKRQEYGVPALPNIPAARTGSF